MVFLFLKVVSAAALCRSLPKSQLIVKLPAVEKETRKPLNGIEWTNVNVDISTRQRNTEK
jgi:hypothetical protein